MKNSWTEIFINRDFNVMTLIDIVKKKDEEINMKLMKKMKEDDEKK